MVYKRVTGTQEERPLEIDTKSSKSVVYIRRDIERVEKEDDQGNTYEVWEYDEAILTPEEYELYAKEMDSPSLDLMMQRINDITANQELGDITVEEHHEEQMQLLNDIQADIAMLDTAETEE